MRMHLACISILIAALSFSSCDRKITEILHLKKSEDRLKSDKAKQAKANAQIMYEMYRVVLLRDPKDTTKFGSLVDSLNQGASLEGVYNGLAHSSLYRELETEHQGATEQALKVFADELSFLAFQFKKIPTFSEKDTRPLALPTEVGVDAIPNEVIFQKPQALPKSEQEYSARLIKLFQGASYFTLKRVLSDEILKLVDEKKADKEGLIIWYLHWIDRVKAYGVGFGLKERDSADLEFHRNWANKTTTDKIRWEILNRVHRLINHMQMNQS